MSDMGGLKAAMPWTFWTFLAGSLALAAASPLLAVQPRGAREVAA
jgi:NADH:ubiquinone oxidoreductase subunit 5 (subunit L)/multisubunit Na+/H+ antiporter MnhA subunit